MNLLSGLNWSQIGSELKSPNSNIAKGIDGAANLLISAICDVDGQQPSSVCGQSFAKLSLAIFPVPSPGGPLSIVVPAMSAISKGEPN